MRMRANSNAWRLWRSWTAETEATRAAKEAGMVEHREVADRHGAQGKVRRAVSLLCCDARAAAAAGAARSRAARAVPDGRTI